MGSVRHAVACVVAKRGQPDSPPLRALREVQAQTAALPSHASIAHAAAATLDASGLTGAVPDPAQLLEGTQGPRLRSVLRVLRQATQAPLPDLLGRGIVRSAETLAVLAPQLTAETVSSRYADPVAGTLAKRIYLAFANRRSVLLVNHQSQVGVDAIPWFTALERAATDGDESLAHAQASDLATLALVHFAGTMLPNSLIRELARLYKLAGEDVPLTYELAADIFMGSFSLVFLQAAQEAATVVGGTLYARYFGIDYTEISRMRTRQGTSRSDQAQRMSVPEFDAFVRARSGDFLNRWSPAANGTVIEQAQILTTQNLAALVKRGVALDPLRQAQASWNATKAHLAKWANGHRLRHRKNAAFAWRQTLFYLSLASSDDVARFVESNQSVGLAPEASVQASSVLRSLAEILEGRPPSAGPFLGWVTTTEGRR